MLLARRRTVPVALAALLIGLALWSVGPAAGPARAADTLVGTFRITPGSCTGGATGSYFRMIYPSGTASGPFFDNNDSGCADHKYTLLAPGSDGGLVTGGYQSAPNPGFDAQGNSLAARVTRPVRFAGVNFSASTNQTDLQTGGPTTAPSVSADGGKLTGDLAAFDATWNRQSFNQGSPKPDRSRPGLTQAVGGTYDAATGAFTLTWISQIEGGPFDKFAGLWHLEGTFVPAGSGGGVVAPRVGGVSTTVAAGSGGPTDGGSSTTIASTVTVPGGGVAAPATPSDGVAAPASVKVEDDGFQAPIWLVLVLAGLGIGGVVVLLVLDRRSGRSSSDPVLEGT